MIDPAEAWTRARQPVNAALGLDPLMLDEIVVTGYGTARKEELTGSVVQIAAQDLELLPTTTFQDVIQGSPGVLVTSRDGAPGAGFNIRVRGIGSITAGSEPLYVIDGVPLFNNPSASTEVDNGGRTANTLASLNPNDIESLVVLKDAASTAIYGSRGANGVVLITTKGGVSGSPIWAAEPRFQLRSQVGVSGIPRDIPEQVIPVPCEQRRHLAVKTAHTPKPKAATGGFDGIDRRHRRLPVARTATIRCTPRRCRGKSWHFHDGAHF